MDRAECLPIYKGTFKHFTNNSYFEEKGFNRI